MLLFLRPNFGSQYPGQERRFTTSCKLQPQRTWSPCTCGNTDTYISSQNKHIILLQRQAVSQICWFVLVTIPDLLEIWLHKAFSINVRQFHRLLQIKQRNSICLDKTNLSAFMTFLLGFCFPWRCCRNCTKIKIQQ